MAAKASNSTLVELLDKNLAKKVGTAWLREKYHNGFGS